MIFIPFEEETHRHGNDRPHTWSEQSKKTAGKPGKEDVEQRVVRRIVFVCFKLVYHRCPQVFVTMRHGCRNHSRISRCRVLLFRNHSVLFQCVVNFIIGFHVIALAYDRRLTALHERHL
jgi:hypothetical protein